MWGGSGFTEGERVSLETWFSTLTNMSSLQRLINGSVMVGPSLNLSLAAQFASDWRLRLVMGGLPAGEVKPPLFRLRLEPCRDTCGQFHTWDCPHSVGRDRTGLVLGGGELGRERDNCFKLGSRLYIKAAVDANEDICPREYDRVLEGPPVLEVCSCSSDGHGGRPTSPLVPKSFDSS